MGIKTRSHPGMSWSAMRKILEQDNICDSLKGRIQYFQTCYRGAHDQTGRVAIRLDGKEIFQCDCFDSQGKYYDAWYELKERTGAEMGFLECHKQARLIASSQVGNHSFYSAFYDYHNHSIDKSLASPNAMVRLFAVLDRRVGKRRLEKLLLEVKKQPEWLQAFFTLRLEADGVINE